MVYEKCGSVLLAKDIMIKGLRWLGHVLRMKDYGFPKIVFIGQPFRVKTKKKSLLNGVGGCLKERFLGKVELLRME